MKNNIKKHYKHIHGFHASEKVKKRLVKSIVLGEKTGTIDLDKMDYDFWRRAGWNAADNIIKNWPKEL